MVRSCNGWTEVLADNDRINSAKLITMDWEESDKAAIEDLEKALYTEAEDFDAFELIEAVVARLKANSQ